MIGKYQDMTFKFIEMRVISDDCVVVFAVISSHKLVNVF